VPGLALWKLSFWWSSYSIWKFGARWFISCCKPVLGDQLTDRGKVVVIHTLEEANRHMSLMMAKSWTLFQVIWLWIVSDMGIPFTTEKFRTSIWHGAQKWNHLEEIAGEDPEESKVCLIATYLAYCSAGIWNYEWLGLLFEDLGWHDEFGKDGPGTTNTCFVVQKT
jgi:hypothetical protein